MKKFKVGDWVRITDKVLSHYKGYIGEIFQIAKITTYYRITINNEDCLFEEYELELVAYQYQFNIGDEVQIPWSAEMLRKEIYTISKLPHDNYGYYLLKDKNSSYEGSFSESGIVKYVAPPLPEKPQPKFKIGDYVYVDNYMKGYDGMIGQISKIIENDKFWQGKHSYLVDKSRDTPFISLPLGTYNFPEQNLLPMKKQEQLKIPAKSGSENTEYVLVPKEDLQKIMKLPSVCYNCSEIMNRWYQNVKT